MTYESIILSHITEYCQAKKWRYKSNRGSLSILCPFCKNEAMTAIQIAKTYKMKCLSCGKKFSLISIVRVNEKDKQDKTKVSKESILQYLKKLLNINVITSIDEKEIDKLFDMYEKNGWSLIPIVRNSKVPAEKAWTEKEHRDKKEWLSWIKDSGLNLGVRCGKVSNLTILDLDIKEIPKELKSLLGETLTQESSKGYHFCYKYEKDLPKGRIDKYKLDIENSLGQVIVSPSSIDGVPRKWINNNPIISMPKELKEFLLSNIKAPVKTLSETIIDDIKTESYKKPLIEEGEGRNELLVRLGGIFRKQLPKAQVEYALNVLNKVICNPSLDSREMRAMFGSLEKYTEFDNEELANEILKYLKHTKTADRLELTRAMKEDNKKLAQVLDYLVREEKIMKAGKYYSLLDKPEWKTALIDAGKPIDFKMPYFYDVAKFRYGDLILLSSQSGYGKTHLAINIVKLLSEQNIQPYYLSRESGSRFTDIALRLGLKEGDFKYIHCIDPTKIEFERNSVTIIDWILPRDYAKSVDKNTPILIKNNNIVEFVPINDLSLHHNFRDTQIWTSKGWNNIKKVIRHKNDKKMYRIITKNTIIECTEDHSLIINNKEISPNQLRIGDRIELIPYQLENKLEIDEEWAWLNGFISAEGTVPRYYTYKDRTYPRIARFRISNNNKKLLEKCKKILLKFGIYSEVCLYKSNKKTYVLDLKGKVDAFCKLISLFHVNKDGTKKVPYFILNANLKAKQAYLDGYIDGDGHRYKCGIIKAASADKTLFTGLCHILQSLNKNFTVHYYKPLNKNQNNKYEFSINVGKCKVLSRPPDVIKDIQIYKDKDYVYDIMTNNNTFSGGMGYLVNLHNTDQLFARLTDQAEKTQSIMIAFVQLRTNGEWYAKDQIEFFPSLTAKYFYDDENDGTYGRFQIYKIREGMRKQRIKEIPCQFNWETKELIRVDELENSKKKKVELKEDNIETVLDENEQVSDNTGQPKKKKGRPKKVKE